MNKAVILAKDLGKRYLIGETRVKYKTLRDALIESLTAPLRYVSRVRDGSAKRREAIWALKDISFEIRQGEVVGIIGPNGAGKSTLLKILSRITTPTTGSVDLLGRVGSLLEVGTGFHPELTGRENTYLNGAILGMRRSEVERKFDEIVAFADIEKFIDTPVKHYSSGMHTRLAFAVAAHLEPEILLVDEVLAVGDFAFQKKCLGKMHDIAGYGRTVLFVSHNMGAIRTLCDRCLFIDNGQIVADGPSDEVIDRYISLFNRPATHAASDRIEADVGEGFVLHRNGTGSEVTIFCGDPIVLEFDIEAPMPLPDNEAGIGITIFTQAGDRIISMSNLVQAVPSSSGVSRVWRIRCDMGRLPLNAGTYFVYVDVGNDRRSGRTAQFSNAFTLRVMESDVFGWGSVLPHPRWWGPLYWAPNWDIRPVD